MRLFRNLAIFSVVAGVGLLPVVTHAYTLNSWSWNSSVSGLNYRWGSNLQVSGSVARTAFENAISDWSATPTKVYFSYNSGSSNTFNTINVADDALYGQKYTTTQGNVILYFNANINIGNNDITTANVARSAAVHELGHGLGLADTFSSPAIMNSSRNRAVTYIPQQDDINGVNAKYGY
ncbi:matrixin family metalloprotease [Tumebacillus flagellatus]|uniref:matrixin family metalloprotease n=1 Tax=Tumebacillus flagellatus TaxID=1157490 RepID=UPI001EE68CB0|nr:matrixin family metalloprotease [Tumebacillus flagellatus]